MRHLFFDSRRLETVKRFASLEPNAAFDRVAAGAAAALGMSGAEAFLVGSESVRVLAAFGLKSGPNERSLPENTSIVLPQSVTSMTERNGELGGMLASYELITSLLSAPLIASDGSLIGSLCVFDQRAISLDSAQGVVIEHLAQTLTDLLEAHLERAAPLGTPSLGTRALGTPSPGLSGGDPVRRLESPAHDLSAGHPPDPNRESSWLAERILESATEAIIALDPEGRVLRWNAGAERLYGYAAREVLGHEITFLMPEFFSVNWQAINQHVLTTGQALELESVHRHREGALIEVRLAFAPLLNEDGQPIGVWSTTRDLRGHGLTRQALTEVVGRHKTLLEFTQHQAHARSLLERTSTVLASIDDEPGVWKALAETIADTPGITGVALYGLKEGRLSLEHGAGAGPFEPSVPVGKGLIGQVVSSGQASVGEGAQAASSAQPETQFVAPIRVSGTVIGVVAFEGAVGFDRDDLRTLEAITSQASLALARFRSVRSSPGPSEPGSAMIPEGAITALQTDEDDSFIDLLEPLELSFDEPTPDEPSPGEPSAQALHEPHTPESTLPESQAGTEPSPEPDAVLEPAVTLQTTPQATPSPTLPAPPVQHVAPLFSSRLDPSDQVGLIVLANLPLALQYVAGVGGLASFTAGMVNRPEWGGDLVVLRSDTLRLIVLKCRLEDLPREIKRDPAWASS
jgi:PAS domain S-box-containing protein